MAQVTTRLPEPEDFEDAALEEALAASSEHLLAALRHSAEQGVFGAEDSRKLHSADDTVRALRDMYLAAEARGSAPRDGAG